MNLQGVGIRFECVSDHHARNSRANNSWLAKLENITSLQQARTIHTQIVSSGKDCGTETGNAIVKMYLRLRCVKEARTAFARIRLKDLASWSIIITAYARQGHYRKVIQSYQRMLFNVDLEPDECIFAEVLEACGALRLPTDGAATHARIVASGLEHSEVLQRSLLKMYSSCECVDSARLVFESLSCRDLLSWNLMISTYACNGHPEEAIALYREMDLEPDAATFTNVLLACSCVKDLALGRTIQALVSCRELGVEVQNALLHMLVHCDCLDEAWKLFRSMKNKNEVSWNVMISTHSNQEKLTAELSREMSVEGVTQNLFTLRILFEMGAVQQVQELLQQLVSCRETDLLLVQNMFDLEHL